MNDEIKHRGLDDDGFYIDNQIALGMRRLSIIDLDTGSQPIYNQDKSLVIIFNGEIYNYKDLKKDLVAKGYDFYTESDTEVILHCYEEYKADYHFAPTELAKENLLKENHEIEVVYPVHLNPVIRELAAEKFEDVARVNLIEPLDYQPFINLMNKSYLILTDSGGIQEEASSLGKPIMVSRDTTEIPEAVHAGTIIKVGTDKKEIYETTNQLLKDGAVHIKMSQASNLYGMAKQVGE
jgi:UDP-N-acetylglucosamine 2-epimerase